MLLGGGECKALRKAVWSGSLLKAGEAGVGPPSDFQRPPVHDQDGGFILKVNMGGLLQVILK